MNAYERHRSCPTSAMSYDDHGARCESCGLRWPLTKGRDGRAVGYLTPPFYSRKAVS